MLLFVVTCYLLLVTVVGCFLVARWLILMVLNVLLVVVMVVVGAVVGAVGVVVGGVVIVVGAVVVGGRGRLLVVEGCRWW